MDVISMALAKPKIVSLFDYYADDSPEATLALSILNLYSGGGGQMNLNDHKGWASFWAAVDTKRSVRMKLATGVGSTNATVYSDEVTIVRDDNGVVMVSFSFMFFLNGLFSVKVILNKNGADLLATVVVDPVTVPNT